MKKVIYKNGKYHKYDTDTAKIVSSYNNEYLYKKRTEEYFIYDSNEGKITPISQENAENWGHNYMSDGEFEKAFKNSSDKKEKTSFYIKADISKKMKRLALEKGISVSELIEDIIEKM